MRFDEIVQNHVKALTRVEVNEALKSKIMGLIDLTSLNTTDTEAHIAEFIERAQNAYGHTAGVCVWPLFARRAVDRFANTPIRVATVANFPEGTHPLEYVLAEISRSLQSGVQEIDVVFPYRDYVAGKVEAARQFVSACKAACGDGVRLKIILETGAMQSTETIMNASLLALDAGADFIKTSTGKIAQGASLEAAATMLLAIKQLSGNHAKRMGIKVSGGIKSIAQAAQYIELADHIMGTTWVSPDTFRIGASQLVDEILS